MTRYRFTIFLLLLGFFLCGIAPVLPTAAWGLEMISAAQMDKLRQWIWPSWGVYATIWAVYLLAIFLYDKANEKREDA